ncbi:MAG: TetR/AcrR family transcriptional regulator, partial [Gammaproteobacteria bacterium]|nr:TetR/AcrR family transcriptional regulator [Gammaproteobacteria bacterium]
MRKKQDKRQKIINTAVKLFVKDGIHQTSIQMLAKKAGVSTGSVYTYFDSKETLVVEAFYNVLHESIEAVTTDYDASKSVKERFYHLLEQRIRYNIKYPTKFQFLNLCSAEPTVMKDVLDNDCETSALATVIIDGKKQGIIRDLPPQDVLYQIIGGISFSLEWR